MAHRLRWRFSLRMLLILITLTTLGVSHLRTSWKLRDATVELKLLRGELGYLNEPDLSKLVATRVPSDEPMTWKLRVRTPSLQTYKIAYSTLWAGGQAAPQWYSAQPLPEGESLITLKLMSDPRDNRWKIITLVRHQGNVWRMATAISDRQAALFRGTHDTIRGGLASETAVAAGKPLRLVEDKWFAGEGGLLLFGQSSPDDDIDGVFAELQPMSNIPSQRIEKRR